MEGFKKITDKMYYDEKIDIKENLVDNVSFHLYATKCDMNMSLEMSMIDCESPIEQLLALELERKQLNMMFLYNPFINVVDIYKQESIDIDGKTYRVDFLMGVIYKDLYDHEKKKQYIIECDGHEFHQKTKQQVENDNKRSRLFQKNGYEIIRFSGSEIHKSPHKCVEDIRKLLLETSIRYLKGN